jgi:hypothetical protein
MTSAIPNATAGIGRCFAATIPSSIENPVILPIPPRMKTTLTRIRPNKGTTLLEEFDISISPF